MSEPIHPHSGPDSDPFPRRRLFGLEFLDAGRVEEIADFLLDVEPRVRDVRTGPLPLVITPNVDQLVKRDRHSDDVADELGARAQFVLADGQPIVWASHLLRSPLQSRLAGSSLVDNLWPRLGHAGRRALVVASSSEIADRVRDEGPTMSAIEAPLLDLSRTAEFDEFASACLDQAVSHGAEFVFVTLGYPKQCNVIDAMIRRWPSERPLPVFLAVGASFDMHYGIVRRAPEFMQRVGLEWFYRFVQEPTRLFRRYFVNDLAFAPMMIREMRSRPRLASTVAGTRLADEVFRRRNARARLRKLPRPLGPSKIVDIGCADGFTLIEAKARGWVPYGVDVNDRARRSLESHGIVSAPDLGALGLANQSVRAVTYFQSLEHVHDPFASLSSARRLLADDGILVIETWNRSSAAARLFGGAWQQITPPSVRWLFSSADLSRMLSTVGFDRVRIRRSHTWVSLGLVVGQMETRGNRAAAAMVRHAGSALYRVAVPYAFGELITVTALPAADVHSHRKSEVTSRTAES